MRRLLAVWAAGLAALVLAAPAQAIDPNSQFDQPAAGQYIETLPGSGGPTAPVPGSAWLTRRSGYLTLKGW